MTALKFVELRALEGYDIDEELKRYEIPVGWKLHSIHYQSNASSWNKSQGWNHFTVLIVLEEAT